MDLMEPYYSSMDMDDLKALEAVLKALGDLDKEVQGRVLRWAAEKLGIGPVKSAAKSGVVVDGGAGNGLTEFASVAEALGGAHAKTDADRALVAGAFLSKKNGQADLTGQEINKHLKDAGHSIANITRAIDALKDRKPQLMVQMKKEGTSRQARKSYKVTAAGFTAAERLLQAPAEDQE